MSFKRKGVLVVLMFVVFISYSQGINEQKLSSFTEEELIQIAIKELNIDKSKTDFINAKVSPNNSDETIVIIPEIVNKDEDVFELNNHIVIVNNKKGVISHKLFESSKETGWVSDAIYIAEISIDTMSYRLSSKQNAFGIVVYYLGSSRPNPYNRKDISIYVKDKKSLKKVLDSYTIYEESGEVNTNINSCYSDINKTVNKLSIANSVTNKYFDFSVTRTNSKITSYKDENGDCDVKEKVVSVKNEQLKFNGDKYYK